MADPSVQAGLYEITRQDAEVPFRLSKNIFRKEKNMTSVTTVQRDFGWPLASDRRRLRSSRRTGKRTRTLLSLVWVACCQEWVSSCCALSAVLIHAAGVTTTITIERMTEVLGENVATGLGSGFHRAKVSQWISKLEEENKFVILVGGASSGWAKICATQADVILIVGDASTSPSVGAREAMLLVGCPAGSWQY